MASTARLLRLLSLLQSRRDWPGDVLAERLEVSPRTVRRDVDRLREMGYRIQAVMGPDGGYRLDSGSELPPLLFDDEQVLALSVALQAATASATVGEAAVRALTTVRQVMPSRLRHRLDAVQFTPIPGRADAASPAVLVALSGAIRAREVLRFDYTGERGEQRRRVEPHHLVTSGGRWYLVAWDLERGDWRTFRVDRVMPVVPSGPRFTPREVPGGDVQEFIAAHFKGADATNTWPRIGSAILHLPASTVRPFAGNDTVEDLGDERSRLRAGSWSWAALAASFGRFDAEIEDAQPRELTEAFAALAERYARAGVPPPKPPRAATSGVDAAATRGDPERMSMEEPLLPHPGNRDPDEVETGAADPGRGAPEAPVDDEPDLLPESAAATTGATASELPDDVSEQETPFRTPEPGESVGTNDLDDA
ncbi:helix-turn-helix transcriptional regulator [Salinibacterium sedimenticola]|uniref:helix-turn-helix transcriptional regulator n=1 Tax=Homoserinimonas sedimenticola TaxID=2986805 RepID=UPI0027E308CF|nr:YafY family protein [Salinibacterium sedimenticola]